MGFSHELKRYHQQIFRSGKDFFYSSSICIKPLRIIVFLKGQCREILYLYFVSWIEAIWAPDKQDEMVLVKNSFLRRCSRKNTALSQTNFFNFRKSPFPGNLGSIWWYFEKYFPKIQNCLTLRGVRLRAVLACAEFWWEQFCLCRPLLALNEKTKKFKNICELLQYSPSFFVSFLKS